MFKFLNVLFGGYGVVAVTGACGALSTGSIPVSRPLFIKPYYLVICGHNVLQCFAPGNA